MQSSDCSSVGDDLIARRVVDCFIHKEDSSLALSLQHNTDVFSILDPTTSPINIESSIDS